MTEESNRTAAGSLRRWEYIVWGALICSALLLHLKSFDEMFLRGHHGWNGSMRTSIARNYVEHGVETGGKPWNNYAPMEDAAKQAHVFWRHPPGANMLVALTFAVFGESEAAARLVPIVSSLISLLLLMSLARRRWGPAGAVGAGVMFILLPIELEVGRMVNYEAPLLAFALASLECVERARLAEGPRRKIWIGLSLVALAAACSIDWPAYIFAFFVGVDALLRKPREPLIFLGFGLVSASLLAFYMWWLPGPGDSWMQVYSWRGGSRITFAHLVENVARRSWLYYGSAALIAFAAAWILGVARRRIGPVLAIFTAVALVYALVFRQATVVHSYYIFYLVPAVVAASAALVAWIWETFPRRGAIAVLVLLGAQLLATNVPNAIDAHWLGYIERLDQVDDVRRDFPETIRIDQALVGKWIAEHTEPFDKVAQHSSLPKPSVQMRQYARRHFAHRQNWPRGVRIFLAREGRLDDSVERRLGQQFGVTRLAGWLIYDTAAEPGVMSLKVVAEPRNLWHDWFVSSTYPPFNVIEDEEGAREYARKFAIPTQSEP